MRHQYSGTKLRLSSGAERSFDNPIAKLLEVDGVVIVMLDDESYSDENVEAERNVFGLALDGEQLWRIKAVRPSFRGPWKIAPFVNVFEFEGKLIARTLDVWFELDHKTGDISNPSIHK